MMKSQDGPAQKIAVSDACDWLGSPSRSPKSSVHVVETFIAVVCLQKREASELILRDAGEHLVEC